MFDLFGHPIPEPEPACDPESEQRYREVVLVVRDGFPVQKLAAIGIDHVPLIERMLAEGVIGLDLKPLHPLDKTGWSEELEALDDALIRLFARASRHE
jgi:hypothetical protein